MPSRKEKLILVVEAGETALSTRKLVLETAGYNVISAVSAEQALRFAGEHDYDLVLYDTDVRDCPPAAALRELRHRAPRVPIYLLASQPWPPDDLRGLAEGLFVKMDDPQSMVAAVDRLLSPGQRLAS